MRANMNLIICLVLGLGFWAVVCSDLLTDQTIVKDLKTLTKAMTVEE